MVAISVQNYVVLYIFIDNFFPGEIMAFGEARLWYMGHPDIVKGIHFGGVDVRRVE
jgi:hypothetical protein